MHHLRAVTGGGSSPQSHRVAQSRQHPESRSKSSRIEMIHPGVFLWVPGFPTQPRSVLPYNAS
jgi:hypothetical protein